MVNNNSIAMASESYRHALSICREVFSTAGREFAEPPGVRDLVAKAREAYTVNDDEAAAVKEIEHAQQWLTGVAAKFLRGGIEYFEGRIKELSYMSLDRDIMDDLYARLESYRVAIQQEQSPAFERRLETYRQVLGAILNALPQQRQRNEDRERYAHEAVARQEQERAERRRQREEQRLAAIAEAKQNREKLFDELFAF